MPYAGINRQRVYFEDSGGDGPPVVLGHGFFLDHEMWASQVESLRDGYRCISWDERCWGQTEFSGNAFDYWDLAQDCISLLDHLGIERAVLAGLSQGGFLAMRAALRHPDRVLALVLADTEPFAYEKATAALYRDMFNEQLTRGWDDDMCREMAAAVFGPGFDSTYWKGKWRARPASFIAPAVECLVNRDDIGDRLGEITCPVLVIHGELDAAFPVDAVRPWASKLPGLTDVVTVPGAGHASPLEKPDFVNAPLREFLDKVTGIGGDVGLPKHPEGTGAVTPLVDSGSRPTSREE